MNRNSKQREAKIHQCEYCQKPFSKKYKLNQHRKIHLNIKDLTCSFCNYATHRKVTLDNHIRSHTKERPFKCEYPDCTANFTTQGHLSDHRRLHSKDGEQMFKCIKCPFKTVQKYSLDNHLKTHENIKEFSCDLCPHQARQKGSLKKHHEQVHLKLKPFKCGEPNCNFASARKPRLNQHLIVHASEEEKEKLLKFKCDQCPYKTMIKGRLNTHLLGTHSTAKKFSCDLCPFRSKYEASVKIHKKIVHIESALSLFKCPQPNCSYSGKSRCYLNRHMTVHGDEKKFKCFFPQCDYKTHAKYDLKRHEMVHRGEKPLKCTLCDFACTQNSSLLNHIRGHTGEKPYPCPGCSYRGKTSSHLKRHLKSCKNRTDASMN